MESLPITQVKNKIISTRRERKCSHNCVRSPALSPRSLFFHSPATPFPCDKARVFQLKIPSQNDVRQEQSFFGYNRRVQMNNDPIIQTPWENLKKKKEDIGPEWGQCDAGAKLSVFSAMLPPYIKQMLWDVNLFFTLTESGTQNHYKDVADWQTFQLSPQAMEQWRAQYGPKCSPTSPGLMRGSPAWSQGKGMLGQSKSVESSSRLEDARKPRP